MSPSILYRNSRWFQRRDSFLSPGNCANDQIRLRAACDRLRQWRVRRFVRQIFPTRVEAQERPALLRHMIADRAAQHRIARLNRVNDRALSHRPIDFQFHLALAESRERPQMEWKLDPNHFSVCASTESTAGKS